MTTGSRCFDFHNSFSLLRCTSFPLINNGTGLIWSKFGFYSQLGRRSIRSWLLWDFFPHYFSWEPLHMCRAFLTFTGYQKSIRVQETKILKVHQYFRKGLWKFGKGCLERDWKFFSLCNFETEQAQFSGTETLSRCQCQMLHPPLAATQHRRPMWNAIHMTKKHCRATEIHIIYLCLPCLILQRALTWRG